MLDAQEQNLVLAHQARTFEFQFSIFKSVETFIGRTKNNA